MAQKVILSGSEKVNARAPRTISLRFMDGSTQVIRTHPDFFQGDTRGLAETVAEGRPYRLIE